MISPRASHHVVARRGTESLTWGQFCSEVGGCARQLAGVHRAALLCRDSWKFAVGLFGLLSAGVTVVVPSHDRQLADVDLVVDDDFSPGHGEWSQSLDTSAPNLHFYTSGSTGQAKCIRRSLGQMNAEIAALQSLWGDRLKESPILSTVPHQHVYGLIFKVLWPLASGRPFLTRQFDLWEEVLAHLPANALLVTSPAHLTRLGGLRPLSPERQPRMILSAGAPLPELAAQEAWQILGVPVTEIYGSTETGAMATRQRDGGTPPWNPLPGYKIQRSAAGVLHLETPEMGCMEIADRIQEDGKGGFHLLGRADRIAKIEGKRVSLDEVEQSLRTLPQIQDAAVVVLAELAAVLVLSPQGQTELAAQGRFRFGRSLRHMLATGLEPAGLPRRWRFVPSLPTSPMGKSRMNDLAGLFKDDGPG